MANQKYTVNHKKYATLCWAITPMFLGAFLHFFHQWRQESIVYGRATKPTTLPHVSALPDNTKNT